MENLLDRPDKLWHDDSGYRRVKAGFSLTMAKTASLYLIKPEKIHSISIWAESNPFEPQRPVKRHRTAAIFYGGDLHHFDIDDPAFATKYFPNFPKVGDSSINVQLPENTLLCVSLTGEYYGHHYKIAAAFFEPPA